MGEGRLCFLIYTCRFGTRMKARFLLAGFEGWEVGSLYAGILLYSPLLSVRCFDVRIDLSVAEASLLLLVCDDVFGIICCRADGCSAVLAILWEDVDWTESTDSSKRWIVSGFGVLSVK